jgi:cytosine/adenosine deaminase-related metal-dependent hydrolase
VTTIVRAKFVATMEAGRGVIENGAVAIDADRILMAGAYGDVRRDHGDARVDDLGDVVVWPGLVNAHTHLELSTLGQLSGPGAFVDWVLALRAAVVGAGDYDAFCRAGLTRGIAESLKFGVAAVGDISLNPAVTRPILAASGLAGVSFGEVLGMAGRRGQLEGRLAAAVDRSAERGGFRAGVEPHAPYSIDVPGFAGCLEAARARGMMLATHLAETPDEAAFLADHSGEFRQLWDALGSWREDVPRFSGGPVAMAKAVGLLDFPTVLAHANYVNDSDLDLLAGGRASVVYCPRTHAYFGHPPHRFAEMLERGINVAVGTDSRASSPDLDLMAELRLIHRRRPGIPAATVLEMGTVNGARALGLDKVVGRLAAGMRASLCAFPVRGGDHALRAVLESEDHAIPWCHAHTGPW